MSELLLAEELLESIQQRARKEGFSKVRHISVEIGQLAEVTPEALRLCLEAVIKNTIAQGARISILETPAQALCLNCGHTCQISERYSACDECGGFDLKVLSGEQTRIKHLEFV